MRLPMSEGIIGAENVQFLIPLESVLGQIREHPPAPIDFSQGRSGHPVLGGRSERLAGTGDQRYTGRRLTARSCNARDSAARRPDLLLPFRIHEWVFWGYRVVEVGIFGKVVAVDIDPKNLAVEIVEILGAVVGVVLAAAIAQRDVEAAIRSEVDPAAVVWVA